MKVVYTDDALRDLDDILRFIAIHYPAVYGPFEARLRASVRRIGQWPESAQAVADRPGVRMVPLVRYPFKIFYRVSGDAVEILHVNHAARLTP